MSYQHAINTAYTQGTEAAWRKYAAVSPVVAPPPAAKSATPPARETASNSTPPPATLKTTSTPATPKANTPKPAMNPIQLPAPAATPSAIGTAFTGAGTQGALVNPAVTANAGARTVLAEFNKEMLPKSKESPGVVKADNDKQYLGNNFAADQNRTVGKAFDNLSVQKNQDFINAGNEGMINT